jgi:hypothetical protein
MRMNGGSWMRSVVTGLASAALALLVGCGGGGSGGSGGGETSDSPMGTLSVSLTDSPACGYDNVWITVEKVRVHRSGTAGEDDAGWVDIPLPQVQPLTPPQPLRVDLLTLTNGALVSLGRVQLPAGSYTQMRLVLAPNTTSEPYANAVMPTGGGIVALKTPSAQQSGLKMNVHMTVEAGQEADFAIDFDACKSIVKAGNSGNILLKPVLSVLPILSTAGQRIQGWLDPALLASGTTVSVQAAGQPVRATPPVRDAGGNLGFVLYPVPPGTYDLVVTAPGRSMAIVSGVPSNASVSTTVNSVAFPIVPPASSLQGVSGTVTLGGSAVDTGGFICATQTLAGGTTVEVASANADPEDGRYAMAVPVDAPVRALFVSGTTPLVFVPELSIASQYLLSATTSRSSQILNTPIIVNVGPVVQDFAFAAVP